MILHHVVEKYGSLNAPNYAFVTKEVETTKHREVIAELQRQGLNFVEHTDINDDVSINFSLDQTLSLWLSLIGPFALLVRHREGSKKIISSLEDCKNDLETLIVSNLSDQKVQLIDKETLLTPVALSVPNRPVDEVKVYQALFADEDEDAFL